MNGASCSIDTCYLDRCPKIRPLEPSVVFTCDICGKSAHSAPMDELENVAYYEISENKKICDTCMDTMTLWDALIFMGCLVLNE